jgi:hypothetical protein
MKRFLASLVFILAAASISWAADPKDALSERPEGSFCLKMSINDVNGTIEHVFSSGKVGLFMGIVTLAMNPENAEGFALATGIASHLPVKSLAFSVGMTPERSPFLQIAAAMPMNTWADLDLITQGGASSGDLNALFGSADIADAEIRQGAKGSYYLIDKKLFLTARDDLLLMALSGEDLEASVNMLESMGKRLARMRAHKF